MIMTKNITKRHLRKIIEEEISRVLSSQIIENDKSDSGLKKRDKNRHKWDWEHSDLPVCKGEDTENCIPKAMADKFKADGIKRKRKKN